MAESAVRLVSTERTFRWFGPWMSVAVLASSLGCALDASSSPKLSPARSITVTPGIVAMKVGQVSALIASVAADSCVDRSLRWTSSDDAGAAAVDQTGKVTRVGAGAVTITGRSVENSSFVATVAVSVANSLLDVLTVGDAYSPAFVSAYRGDTVRRAFSGGSDGAGHNVRSSSDTNSPADIPVMQ